MPAIEAEAQDDAKIGVAAPAAKQTEQQARGRGGRLFDKWYAEIEVAFVPDDPSTEAIDGQGGPFGNGSLPDAQGEPMKNSGHDYRMKNLFGWDLRGQRGLYGPDYADKEHVLVPSVLADTDTRAQWLARLREGHDAIPAYGAVLSEADLEAVVDFMLAMREGELPQPDDVYLLADGPGHYRLRKGGDATRGHSLFANRGAECHGQDGTEMLFDDGAYSLGTLARKKAYEVFMKILSGQPGTPMHAQVEGPANAQAQQALDLLTALCDRTRYPAGKATGGDVPDDDPRCGEALK